MPSWHDSGVTRRPLAALAALLFALSLGACGSDDPAPTSSGTVSPTESTTTTTPAEETTEPASPEPSQTEPTEPTTDDPSTATAPTAAPPVGDTPPATYADAVARFDALGQEPQQLSRFESPSGNLYCVLDSDFIPPSCELLKGAILAPELCGDGPSQVVGRIEFTDGDPQPVCNSDTIREPDAPVLGYTGVAAWDGTTIQCLIETIGVTCIDTAATRGFFLARGQYAVFTVG